MDFSVQKIAGLAYLELTAEEQKAFALQMGKILDHADELKKVSMSAEEAKAMGAFHVTTAFYDMLGVDASVKLRSDLESKVESLTLSNAEAVQSAPKTSGLPGELLFEVPSILSKD